MNIKKSVSTAKIIFPVAALIYCGIVIAFLFFGFGSPTAFQSSAPARILTSVFSIILIITLWCSIQRILTKLHLISQTRYAIFAVTSVIVTAIIAMLTPFSPNYDSYDMCGFLEKLVAGETTDYMTGYFSAYSSNHMTALIYLPFVKLFGSIETGTRILNAVFLCAGVLLISASCKKMFKNTACGELSLVISALLFPSLLMVGPYIYPPAIFLASAAMFLYHCKSKIAKAGFLAVGGLLFTLRPMASGFILVYILFEKCFTVCKKHKFIISAGKTAIVLICFMLVKSTVGSVFYHTGLHPYKNLSDASMLWTLELGTRPNDEASGLCSYFPYTSSGFDEISTQFADLWSQYSKGADADANYVNNLKHNIFKNIIQRGKTTLFEDTDTAYKMLGAKFVNYYSDGHRPYYYISNIYSPDFGDNVSHNYEKRYFLYMNAFMIIFYICAVVLLTKGIVSFIKRKKLSIYLSRTLALILGVIATSLLAIFITEVGKRLVFDIFVPMCPVICYALYRLALFFQKTDTVKKRISVPAGLIISAICLYCFYNAYNISFFKGCSVRFSDENILIEFRQKITDKGYSVLLSDGSEIPLYQKSSLSIPNEKNSDNYFQIKLPTGELYQVAKLRRQ